MVWVLPGIVAAALGLSGIAAVTTQMCWILFVAGIVLLIIHVARGVRFEWPSRNQKTVSAHQTIEELHVWDKSLSGG